MKKLAAAWVWLVAAVMLATACSAGSGDRGEATAKLTVASQGYGEVEVQAELAKQLIEGHTDHKVEHLRNFGGATGNLLAASKGDLDMFIGFTGTYFLGAFEQVLTPEWRDPDKVWQYVHDRLLEEYGVYTFESYGYNNVYGIAVPGKQQKSTI